MTVPIVQRLRETAAALSEERVSMQTLAQAHGPAAYLPQRVAELELSRHWAQRVLGMLASAYSMARRVLRARLRAISHPQAGGHGSPWRLA